MLRNSRYAMNAPFRPEIVDTLRQEIVRHRFEPGSRLPILELQDRFGVGLTALHKALAHLAADGLVVAESERGVRAAPVSRADLEDLTKARLGIEALAIRDAVAHATEASDAQIVAALYTLSRTPRFEEPERKLISETYRTRHRAFHEALTAACSSSWLQKFRAILFVHAERYQQLSAVYRDGGAADEHAALVQAVIDRDADRAATLLTAHISAAAELLLQHCFTEAQSR